MPPTLLGQNTCLLRHYFSSTYPYLSPILEPSPTMQIILRRLLLACCASIVSAIITTRSHTNFPSFPSPRSRHVTNRQASDPLESKSSSTTNAEYLSYAQTVFEVLQNTWYNQSTGLWGNQWWNSANALVVLAELSNMDSLIKSTAEAVYTNVFANAPIWNLHNFGGVDSFINPYYDDEGWWALAWIKVYDQTQNQTYLKAAIDIFNDMTTGWGAYSCGGMLWEKGKKNDSAISNELFLSLAASLANRLDGTNKQIALDWALLEWDWLTRSGLLNPGSLVMDSLDYNDSCKPDTLALTYNQGVILGGLVALNEAAPSGAYLTTAKAIANATMNILVDSNGVLKEFCDPSCDKDPDWVQFKGIYIRNLLYLHSASPEDAYVTFIEKNADSIWQKARNGNNEIGSAWNVAFNSASVQAQISALDCLVAAVVVSM
ncbi:hypothetical protein N7G274_008052 [Stereocaulon virgatum]|uniref:Glycoside hydrolase family 76 protein n=1 Tax=Stereocaulon virgatum TaxID=373712 RepID=A0ABR4A1N0_9LECA